MKITDVLIVYLTERIIIFPVQNYFNILLVKVIDKLSEWELLSTKKKITGREKFFKFFVEKIISDILLEIKIVYKQHNLKILTVYKETEISPKYLNFLNKENCVKEIFIKSFNKIFKKYFIKNLPNNINFLPTNKIYKGLKCGTLTGEEKIFVDKILSKWKSI